MQRKRVLTGMAIAALTAGCSALPPALGGAGDKPPAYINVTRTDEITIQLVPQDAAAQALNEHPAAFEPAQLQALLSSLRVIDKDGQAITLASPSRLKQLAADMSKAFVRAGPRQDVAFSVFRSAGKSIFTSSRKVTSGRAFYRDDTLNIIFGEFDADFSEFRDVTISPLKYGNRAGADTVNTANLVRSNSWHRHGDRRDWIELPATPEAIESAAAAAPTAIESTSSGAAQPLQYGPAASAPGTAAPMPAAPAPSAPMPVQSPAPGSSVVPAAAGNAGVGAAASAGPAAGSDWDRIEERLTQLKRLRDRNLITAQDYQNKKDALLRQLP